MRLAGIDSIDAANAWLPTFIERHNQRFERAPQSPVDSHRAVLHDREALRLILSHHHTRTLSKNLTFQFCNREYQIQHAGKDRKSTRLNSSHVAISYAVFCLKKKRNNHRSLVEY